MRDTSTHRFLATYRIDEEPPGMTSRRFEEGARWIDRSQAGHVPVRRRGVRGIRRRHAGERAAGERRDGRVPQPDPRPAPRDHDRRPRGAERVRRGQRALVRPDRGGDDGRAGGRAGRGAAGGRRTPDRRRARRPRRPITGMCTSRRWWSGGGPSGRAAARGGREPRRPRPARGRAPPRRRPTGRRRRPAGTTALGVYDDGYVVALERSPDRDRLWHVRAGSVILATGATERPIAFAGNDRPGVMLASPLRPTWTGSASSSAIA